MSLKARIEAVIYAAEEPVTLAALASLFRDDALALRAQRLAAPNSGASEREAPLAGHAVPPEPAATESLTALAPPIPSVQEEPPPAAADPLAELAASPATDSFPDGVPPSSTQVPASPEARETPFAERAVSAEGEVPAASDEAQDRKAEIAERAAARDEIRRLIDELRADYASADRGIEIREVAGGYRMATRAEYHDAVRAFIKTLKAPMKLSLQALETLAVIAYKQPVTAPEIGDIRGVDTSGVLGSLIARKLITTAGRKQVVGRPILYKTTKEFLLRFGLKDLAELPSMEEFEKMAGALAEAEDETAAPQAAEGELPFAEDEAIDQAADEVRAEEARAEEARAEEAVAAESAESGEGQP